MPYTFDGSPLNCDVKTTNCMVSDYYRALIAFSLIFSFLGLSIHVSAQQSASPPVATILRRSLSTLSGGAVATIVILTGQVHFVAGSQKEEGVVRLLSDITGSTRTEIRLPSENLLETRRLSSHDGEKRGKSGKTEKVALHNVLRSSAWFFPEHYIEDALSAHRGLYYVPCPGDAATGYACIHSYVTQGSTTKPDIVSAITGADIQVDVKTMLPSEIRFYAHTDKSASVNIETRIVFLDYQTVGNHMIPFHIKKYINGLVNMDITITAANLDASLVKSDFTLN